jgi:hypothetical protein
MYTDVGQVLVRFHQSFVQLNAGVPPGIEARQLSMDRSHRTSR